MTLPSANVNTRNTLRYSLQLRWCAMECKEVSPLTTVCTGQCVKFFGLFC